MKTQVIKKAVLGLKKLFYSLLYLFVILSITSCTSSNKQSSFIAIDGSSTVFPITESIVEEAQKAFPQLRIGIGVSGTGGGFRKFISGKTLINNASRKIKEKEVKLLMEKNVEFLEFPVAYDGLSIIVNKDNTWVDFLSVDELHKIWKKDSQVKKWSDIRSSWPKEKIDLYGPGSDSGTFDYFTEVINKKSGSIRSDYTQSEDDNILVLGVSGKKQALAFLGFSYYYYNKTKIKAVPIWHKNSSVKPGFETIKKGTYTPLSRPLYIYVRKDALKQKHFKEFLVFYMSKAVQVIPQVGYVPLNDKQYNENIRKISSHY